MIDIHTELTAFHNFATERISVAGNRLSLDELYDEWRSLHPSNQELAVSIAAVAASLCDLDRGIEGKDACTLISEMRDRFGLKE